MVTSVPGTVESSRESSGAGTWNNPVRASPTTVDATSASANSRQVRGFSGTSAPSSTSWAAPASASATERSAGRSGSGTGAGGFSSSTGPYGSVVTSAAR